MNTIGAPFYVVFSKGGSPECVAATAVQAGEWVRQWDENFPDGAPHYSALACRVEQPSRAAPHIETPTLKFRAPLTDGLRKQGFGRYA
jgi:hypothetical protein